MVTRLEPRTFPELPGVEITYLRRDAGIEIARVDMEPGAEIPLHSHLGDAEMHFILGDAELLSKDQYNGTRVSAGDRITFPKKEDHGFLAGRKGGSFVSVNPGFLKENGQLDIAFSKTPV